MFDCINKIATLALSDATLYARLFVINNVGDGIFSTFCNADNKTTGSSEKMKTTIKTRVVNI